MAENHGRSVTELRKLLPYTEAVLLEIQRLGNVAPFALMHTITSATTIGEFTLPSGTCVIPNLTDIHMDPKTFPEPDKFKPERFLDDNGAFVPHPSVIPFGVGKRRCLGENLAKVELFIFFANLMHNFEVRPECEAQKPSTMYRLGVTICPLPFKARFIARH